MQNLKEWSHFKILKKCRKGCEGMDVEKIMQLLFDLVADQEDVDISFTLECVKND